jgi:hypothetical protein
LVAGLSLRYLLSPLTGHRVLPDGTVIQARGNP